MGSLSKQSPRRWSFERLIPVCLFVARRAYASAPNRKKKVQVDGRSWGFCWQLAEMCSATCWLSAERTSLMGGCSGSAAAEWSMRPAGGKLMRPEAETRSVLLMDGVWAVPLRRGSCNSCRGTHVTKSRDEYCAPKSSVVRT